MKNINDYVTEFKGGYFTRTDRDIAAFRLGLATGVNAMEDALRPPPMYKGQLTRSFLRGVKELLLQQDKPEPKPEHGICRDCFHGVPRNCRCCLECNLLVREVDSRFYCADFREREDD